MSIQETIREELKDAMKAKDDVRLRTIRNMLTSFTNEAVATGGKPQDALDDEKALTVISRLAKQRKDSIEQYTKGGRDDLAEEEKKELVILEKYLPAMMSQDDIRPFAEKKKTEMGIDDKSKAGQLMGAIMKDLKGKASGDDVKAVVDSLFE